MVKKKKRLKKKIAKKPAQVKVISYNPERLEAITVLARGIENLSKALTAPAVLVSNCTFKGTGLEIKSGEGKPKRSR